ncbi:GntR family transcriptional regulator [Sporolactobacillus terrae]|uniref:HTH-type transcriptional repressor DasR n=1 Tax=Sporolactobacillus terrae TaxID=269673 RepID=A0A5K7WTA7_9BACL|nr:GntR family transcriptional regulator [Sporolactobacillus terrae]BBN97542.1 HTH-type transcriptional repressor DasR [Sporolactobacillus terrae]
METEHLVIADYFIQAIEQAVYQEGERLPSESELREQFGVKRSVARRAVARLCDSGWITTIQGKGSFVAARSTPLTYALSSKTAFTEEMMKNGVIAHAELLHWEKRTANQHERRLLHLDHADWVYQLEIRRRAGRLPLSMTTTCLVERIVPDLELHLDPFVSLYRILSGIYRLQPQRLSSVVRASLPNADDAAQLEISAQSPILQVESLVSHRGIVPIEYSRSRIRGDLQESRVSFS